MKYHKLLIPVVWAIRSKKRLFWTAFAVWSAVVLLPIPFPLNFIIIAFFVWVASRA